MAKRPPKKLLRADGMLNTACSNAAASRREERLLLKRVLLWQRGGMEKVGVDTAAAEGKYRKGSCWSGHCCGSGEI